MRWRKKISREVSSSLPAVGIGLGENKTTSKLKLPKAAPLPQLETDFQATTLTSVGRTVQATTHLASRLYAAPRLLMHFGIIAAVTGVVLTSSTGHPAKLNPLASQVGYGSVLEQAASADVAAKVADHTNLLVSHDVDSTAQELNAQVSLPTSDDDTLAKRQVVDTAGSSARGIATYTVKPGDTLASIAERFNVTSDTVRWANGLDVDGALKPGQALAILPISGIRYTVQAGDTADSIAGHFQSNADQLIAFNNAEVSGLQPGQTVIVPDGVMPEAARPAAATAAPAAPAAATPLRVAQGGRNAYAYGYCTWYVATRRAIPGWWGNAVSWYSNAQISGYSVGSVPRVGAIAWTGAGYYGHVAYVEGVSGGNVTVSEMNWNGNWNRVTSRTVPASSFRYIY